MVDKRLQENTSLIGESKLSELRLMRDGEIDWLLIIPKREVTEFIELEKREQDQLWQEILEVSELVKSAVPCDKLNIGALGNMVPHLHVHIIARKKSDRAWPGAIWGSKTELKFDESKVDFWKEKFSKTSFAI